MTKNCTIGIPAYNEQESLVRLLESLKIQEIPPDCLLHIVVMANGCTDNTVQVALDFGRVHWGAPRILHDSILYRWSFDCERHTFSVCDVPLASKRNALNIIHQIASGGFVLLFDADVYLDPGVIKAMYFALLYNPEYGVVATQYRGFIPPVRKKYGLISEWCRVIVSRAINHFDRYTVRLDGQGCGYRHSFLVWEQPELIAADVWLEGVAWQHSTGCIYLRGYYVNYQLPDRLNELIIQYIRYNASTKVLFRKYPDLSVAIYNGRRYVQQGTHQATLLYRFIGWLFFTWINLCARNRIHDYVGEQWEVIQSTKKHTPS